jgi:hypothetical protein
MDNGVAGTGSARMILAAQFNDDLRRKRLTGKRSFETLGAGA